MPWARPCWPTQALGEISALYMDADPRFRGAYRAFGDDRDADGSWRLAFLELLVLLGDARLQAEGRQLALARLRSDVEHARRAALEEESE